MQSLWMVVAAVFYAVYGVCIKFASLEGIGAWEVLFYPENRGIYTQSDSPKKSSRNIWSLAVVSVDQRY